MAAGPQSKFAPEIRASMKGEPGDTPAEIARDKKRGIKQGSAADKRDDAAHGEPGDTPAEVARDRLQGIRQGSPADIRSDAGGMPADAHHVAAAAGIAHAILNRRQ